MFPTYKTRRFKSEAALDEWLNSFADHNVRITIEGIFYDIYVVDKIVVTISLDTPAEVPKDKLESILGISQGNNFSQEFWKREEISANAVNELYKEPDSNGTQSI